MPSLIPNESDAEARFHTTRWTLVLRANADSTSARLAFSELAEAYWHPLYAFLRRKQMDAHDAEDTIQSFFGWMLENDIFSRADPQRGRLRTFLMTALLRYRSRERRFETAQKRYPDSGKIISLATIDLDACRLNEPDESATPEQAFERDWALAVIGRAMKRLKSEQEKLGNGPLFAELSGFLTGQQTQSGRHIAAQFAMTEQAVRAATYRLKRRYGVLLREEVADTIDSPDDVDDELKHLMAALNP